MEAVMQDGRLSFGPPPLDYLVFVARIREEAAGTLVHILESEQFGRLDGDILPPGTWLTGTHEVACDPKPRSEPLELPERLAFLESLAPSGRVAGVRGFASGREYIAYLFGNYVVAECPRLQNAIYVFSGEDDSWMDLIQLSKLDLITGNHDGFICRIVHQGDWQGRLLGVLNSER